MSVEVVIIDQTNPLSKATVTNNALNVNVVSGGSSSGAIEYNNAGGTATPVSPTTPLPVTEFTNEVFTDDSGTFFTMRDTGTTGTPSFSYFKFANGQAYIPQGTPRALTIDNKQGSYTSSSTAYITVQYAAIANAGSGYLVDDLVTLSGGTFVIAAVGRVTQINSTGGIVGISFACNKGATIGAYSVAPTNPVSQASTTGSGTGATFTLTTANYIGAMVDTTGYMAVQLAYPSGSISGSGTAQFQGSLDGGVTWGTIPWTFGASNSYVTGSSSVWYAGGSIALVTAPPPLVRLVYGAASTLQMYWALRSEPVEPVAQTVNQGGNSGTNNFWYVTQQASSYGAPYAYTAVINTATTNAAYIGYINRFYQIRLDNTSSSPAYLKLFNKTSTPVPGTDTPYAVYTIPANGNLYLDVGSMGQSPSGRGGTGYAITANPALLDATALPTANVIVGTMCTG